MFEHPRFHYAFVVSALLLALVLSACGEEVTSPSTDAPPEEPEEAVDVAPEDVPELLFRMEYGDERVQSVAFSPDGALVAGGASGEARLWQVSDGALASVIEYRHSVDDLAFSPDGSLLGAGQGVYGVQLMRVVDGEELHQLHGGYNNYLAFSPDGETVATGNRNGVVWLWRVEDGEQLAEFEPPISEWLTALAFSPDGETLASGHWDGSVLLWRVRDGQLLHALDPQFDYAKANDLAFSPDGEFLAVVGARHERDDVVRLWRVADGSIHQELSLSQEGKAVVFSSDGRWLAAGSQAELALWELPEFVLRHSFDHVTQSEEPDWITGLDFSPDSTLLAAGRWSGVLELWRLAP